RIGSRVRGRSHDAQGARRPAGGLTPAVLPQAYGTTASIGLILGGAITCFAGYRLFRFVLGIYGFVLGAMIASSTMGVNSTGAMVAAALVGGLVGAVVLMLAYFVGIALIGAGLGALLANVAWGQIAG